MPKILQDAVRVVAASLSGMIVGAFYYNPEISSLGMMWFKENFPKLQGNVSAIYEELGTPTAEMGYSMISMLILSLLINQYVNVKQLPVSRLVQMSTELGIMVTCLQLPHTLYARHSVHAFIVDQIYNFLVVLAMSLILGYNRFDEQEKEEVGEPKKRPLRLDLDQEIEESD